MFSQRSRKHRKAPKFNVFVLLFFFESMSLMESLLILLGAAVLLFYGIKLLLFCRMLYPHIWFPVPPSYFSSMGEWAVVTGASEGIGKAYAFALAEHGMNVVIMSRTKEMLDQVAKEISDSTGQKVKVLVTDFTQDVFSDIEDQLKDMNIGVLVNNVALLPTIIPINFLKCPDLDRTITTLINCNVKAMVKMCKIILPGMESRGKGVILNLSSGVAAVPFPLYSLYMASKVFVERFSQGLQAEYKDRGINVQAVAPFAVATRMVGYQKVNKFTLSPKAFVERSLQFIRAGDKTYGSIRHTVMAWILQSIPPRILATDWILRRLQAWVKRNASQKLTMPQRDSENSRNYKD